MRQTRNNYGRLETSEFFLERPRDRSECGCCSVTVTYEVSNFLVVGFFFLSHMLREILKESSVLLIDDMYHHLSLVFFLLFYFFYVCFFSSSRFSFFQSKSISEQPRGPWQSWLAPLYLSALTELQRPFGSVLPALWALTRFMAISCSWNAVFSGCSACVSLAVFKAQRSTHCLCCPAGSDGHPKACVLVPPVSAICSLSDIRHIVLLCALRNCIYIISVRSVLKTSQDMRIIWRHPEKYKVLSFRKHHYSNRRDFSLLPLQHLKPITFYLYFISRQLNYKLFENRI